MSIERYNGEITFVCDGDRCNEIFETGTDEFHEGLRDLKNAGWKVRKVVNEWMHFCPDEEDE